MFDKVCKGRRICDCRTSANPTSDAPMTAASVQRTACEGCVRQSRKSATAAPGRPAQSTKRAMRLSLLIGLLQPAVERAAREAERVRRLAHVALEARERPLDEPALRLLQRHGVEIGRRRSGPEAEIVQLDALAARHEKPALHGVLQLTDVARPGIFDDRLQRRGREGRWWMPVLAHLPEQEVLRQERDVLAPLAQ